MSSIIQTEIKKAPASKITPAHITAYHNVIIQQKKAAVAKEEVVRSHLSAGFWPVLAVPARPINFT